MVNKSAAFYLVLILLLFVIVGFGAVSERKGFSKFEIKELLSGSKISSDDGNESLGISRCDMCPIVESNIECKEGKVLIPDPDIDVDNNCYCPRSPICMN